MKSQFLYIMSNWFLIVFSLIENVMNSLSPFSPSYGWRITFLCYVHINIALPVVVVVVVILRHPSLFIDTISVFVCFTSIIVTLRCWLSQSVLSSRGKSFVFHCIWSSRVDWRGIPPCAWISRHGRLQNNRRRATKMKKDE